MRRQGSKCEHVGDKVLARFWIPQKPILLGLITCYAVKRLTNQPQTSEQNET